MRFVTLSLFATLLSAPAFAADLGTYRPGTPYSTVTAPAADVCDNQCAGDAQCRGWNYVKPNPRAAGICEFLSSVSAPISSQISISGESDTAAPFSTRLTAGSTNTVRVGTQSSSRSGGDRGGQGTSNRRIIRQAPPERVVLQKASTRSVENMSLTEQQNRLRNAQAGIVQGAPQPHAPQLHGRQHPAHQQHAYAPQRQMFRPVLDAAGRPMPVYGQQQGQPQGQYQGQHIQQPHPQNAQGQGYTPRRATGPRRAAGQFQNSVQGQGYPAPQFQDPRAQNPYAQGPYAQDPRAAGQQFQAPPAPQQVAQRGNSRPPVGQPIPAPEVPALPQRSTPGQRLAKMTAETMSEASAVPSTGPMALSPEQARTSLFGKMHDDLRSDLPTASAVPTQPVAVESLDAILAGGH